MCEDCVVGPALSRRRLLSASPAALAATLGTVVAGQAPAYGARRRVERICRAAWGAQPVAGVLVPHEIERLTIHHSAVALRDNRDAPRHVRVYQQDHQSRGWPDLAYHLVVDRHGNVYQGRPLWAVGDSSTPYDPTGHLLVLCIGSFDVQRVSKAQLSATIDVLAWASARFGVSPRTIRGHQDYAATACPGDGLYRYIVDGTIRRRVARRAGNVRMVDLCGRAGRRRVRRIEKGTD
jgi:hypothetical protein